MIQMNLNRYHFGYHCYCVSLQLKCWGRVLLCFELGKHNTGITNH